MKLQIRFSLPRSLEKKKKSTTGWIISKQIIWAITGSYDPAFEWGTQLNYQDFVLNAWKKESTVPTFLKGRITEETFLIDDYRQLLYGGIID